MELTLYKEAIIITNTTPWSDTVLQGSGSAMLKIDNCRL